MSHFRPDGSERRRHPRHVVDLPTHIVIKGQVIGCRLIDVSRGGALVAGPAAVTVGDRVLLQMPGEGDVVATVVRTTPVSFALAFAGTIVLSMAGDGDADEAQRGERSQTLQEFNPRRLM
jgi:hypothetical protein